MKDKTAKPKKDDSYEFEYSPDFRRSRKFLAFKRTALSVVKAEKVITIGDLSRRYVDERKYIFDAIEVLEFEGKISLNSTTPRITEVCYGKGKRSLPIEKVKPNEWVGRGIGKRSTLPDFS